MDQVKIGKYLSEKRKSLGLTQAQVADKLNMSDKSVSKWERGVCLPDVSLYQPLCSLLEISVNEFLAGEDISSDNLGKKSEDTIIQVAEDSKHRQKRLKWMTGIFVAVAVLALTALLFVLLPEKDAGPRNYLEQISDSSADMYSMLSGKNAYIYRYVIPDEYHSLTLCYTEYRSGNVFRHETLIGFGDDFDKAPHEGTILFVFDPDEYTLRVLMTEEYGSSSINLPLLQDVPGREWLGRSFTNIEATTPVRGEPYRKKAITLGEECGIGAFLFGNHMMFGLVENMNGPDSIGVELLKENDYACYFSLITEK